MDNLVKYLEVDEDANVYVVGDIHACYTQLKDTLKEVGFNYNTDLLIAVGDLVWCEIKMVRLKETSCTV